MSSPGGSAGGGSDDVEADKSRRDSELRSNGDLTGPDINSAIDEVDDVLPSVEDFDISARRPSGGSYFDLHRNIDTYGGERLDQVLRTPSPVNSANGSGSIPDDTPSPAGSYQALTPSIASGSPRSISRTPSGAIKPFERRFQSRFSISPTSSQRAISPAFLNTHSRQSSLSLQIPSQNGDTPEAAQAPWEVVRWTRLKKISGQAFSEVGRRQLGAPTCLAVSASIIIGTSKGLILIFDYNQNLKAIVGQGTKAAESGAVTALAISADYSAVAGGHATGNIFTWEIARPAKPFLSIPPLAIANKDAETDGHIEDRSVLHIGFLGTRHTALVSADNGGMAFSHLATRGLGAVGRSVRTTRLLGRYPSLDLEGDSGRKPSSVLAFAPLPLGNVEQATDTMGLTALLTPYLLVIVSTTPIAQTQHKASRPKDVAAHGAVSGCLAWFPAVRLKTAAAGRDESQTKLVYCWSDILTVLEVDIGQAGSNDKEKQGSLSFQPRSRWKSEEAIVAVQWLSRSVIGVLTISQRLVILEDGDLHVMDSVDLIQRHIYHRDFFSDQLHTVVEQNENEAVIHGVVADAFYMSFRAYKGRLFLMSFSDVSVGTLSNWADRLSALVEHGDDIGAIRLAISYYNGRTGKVSVGLPEDDASRHILVRERLLELLAASLRYHLTERVSEAAVLHELVEVCFDGCILIDEIDFLLTDAYDFFEEAGEGEVFIDALENYILEGNVTSLPPPLVKDVVVRYSATGQESRLEEILCRIDAHTFDIEQVTRLCKEHLLYDALIYVWNQALSDWITPLTDLLALIRDRDPSLPDPRGDDDRLDAAAKVFPYLAFSLTGRMYPSGDPIDETRAIEVRHELYKFVFAANTVYWPPGTKSRFSTTASNEEEPAFPYLQLLLHFDTPNFMSMLNEVFEDPFLNANQDSDYNVDSAPASNGVGSHMTRQQIVSILFEIMTLDAFDSDQIAYLDIFIARSLPKYPQFLILSGSTLQRILDRLCTNTDTDLAEESELSVEYLLSVYHPPMTDEMIEQIHEAGFYRVLKSIYRSSRRYPALLNIFFEDPKDKIDIFVDIRACLGSEVGAKQKQQIGDLLSAHAQDLVFIDLPQTVQTVQRYLPERLDDFLAAMQAETVQYAFLQELLEPGFNTGSPHEPVSSSRLASRFSDRYIELMCVHDPPHVAQFVSSLDSGDLHLQHVLPVIERNGVVDAAVLLLAKDGLAREAIDRLVNHITTMQNALSSLIESEATQPDDVVSVQAVSDLLQEVDKYVKLGIWLCQGQSVIGATTPLSPVSRRRRHHDFTEKDLTLDEFLWVTLVDTVVQMSKAVTNSLDSLENGTEAFRRNDPASAIRALVQQVFTALLASTSGPSKPSSSTLHSPATSTPLSTTAPSTTRSSSSFIPIFRCFLTRAARTAPSLQDLRGVLLDIFAAYAHEAELLSLASQLLDADSFGEISAVHERRQQGWRPRAQVCERCKRRAWGPGIGGTVFDAWVDGEVARQRKSDARKLARRGDGGDGGSRDDGAGKGKGRGKEEEADVQVGEEEMAERTRLELVVFACKHVLHRQCLELLGSAGKAENGRYKCPSCEEGKL